MFFEIAQYSIQQGSGRFTAPLFYPGPNTTLTFANVTSRTLVNSATINVNLTGIVTGDDMYSSFCTPSAPSTIGSATSAVVQSTGLATASPTSTPTPLPTAPGYPYPVIKHPGNFVAGYFLNGIGYDDVAVLAMPSFEPTGSDAEDGFQAIVEAFLAAAVEAKMTKLIVDVSANGGGDIDLGWDTFAQLFPSMRPNTLGNSRATLGSSILG
jgi:hypothetical protein